MKLNSIDPIFSDPLLANIYDAFDPDRSDIEPYVTLIKSYGVSRVTDLGCGTGVLAIQLAKEGFEVLGIDPAKASIDVARAKPGADHIEWIASDASALRPDSTELVVMTGNVAQAIINPNDWKDTLGNVKSSLVTGGNFIFETRKPEAKAWQEWTKEKSFQTVLVPDIGRVDGWVELTSVTLPLVSFRWTYFFHQTEQTIISDSTLRFRTIDEITNDLDKAGFIIKEVLEAPDRPGKEFVIVAQAKA